MSLSNPRKLKTSDLAYCAMFTSLIVICSWISIPAAIPFTLQTFAIFLAVITLGGRRGTLSIAVYILLGAIGLPVFSGFSGGIGYMFGSTGGFILGFLLSGLIVWTGEYLTGRRNWCLILFIILGQLVCYVFGTAWFLLIYSSGNNSVSIWTALAWYVFPYVIPDIIKISLAYIVGKKITRSHVIPFTI